MSGCASRRFHAFCVTTTRVPRRMMLLTTAAAAPPPRGLTQPREGAERGESRHSIDRGRRGVARRLGSGFGEIRVRQRERTHGVRSHRARASERSPLRHRRQRPRGDAPEPGRDHARAAAVLRRRAGEPPGAAARRARAGAAPGDRSPAHHRRGRGLGGHPVPGPQPLGRRGDRGRGGPDRRRARRPGRRGHARAGACAADPECRERLERRHRHTVRDLLHRRYRRRHRFELVDDDRRARSATSPSASSSAPPSASVAACSSSSPRAGLVLGHLPGHRRAGAWR